MATRTQASALWHPSCYTAEGIPQTSIHAIDNVIISCVCDETEACPHSSGFWRQQCDQSGNVSAIVCYPGMVGLWRRLIAETGVIQWRMNDGSFETTAALAALSDSSLFTALSAQIETPQPVTIHDRTESQYLGLMLNIYSGALPLTTELRNAFNGIVAQVIDSLETALNTGVDLEHWNSVADDINNRIGIDASGCAEGDDLFRNIPPCNTETLSPVVEGIAPARSTLATWAFPNPVSTATATIFYRLPAETLSTVEISIFDMTGRLVRKLPSDENRSGEGRGEWDLVDEGGRRVRAGIYFYRVTAGELRASGKLVLAH